MEFARGDKNCRVQNPDLPWRGESGRPTAVSEQTGGAERAGRSAAGQGGMGRRRVGASRGQPSILPAQGTEDNRPGRPFGGKGNTTSG